MAAPGIPSHISSEVPGISAELKGLLALHFAEPCLEEDYQEAVYETGIPKRPFRIFGFGGFALVLGLMYGSGSQDIDWLARGTVLVMPLFCCFYGLLLLRWPYYARTSYRWIMLASMLYMVIPCSLTRDRWARLVHDQEQRICTLADPVETLRKCVPRSFMEANSVLSVNGLLTMCAFLIQLPSWLCFLLLHCAVLTCMGMTWALGSVEHRVIMSLVEAEGAWKLAIHYGALLVQLYLIGFLIYFSRRYQEISERGAFASEYVAFWQQEKEAQEKYRALMHQAELEQRLHALMMPHDSLEHVESLVSQAEDGSMLYQASRHSCHTSSSASSRYKHKRTLSSKLPSPREGFPINQSEGGESGRSSCSQAESKWLKVNPFFLRRRTAFLKIQPMNSSTDAMQIKTVPPPPPPWTHRIMEPTAYEGAGAGPAGAHLPQKCLTTERVLGGGPPNQRLTMAMANRTADWARIHSMAEKIRSPQYLLRQFFEDCVASFPELGLFSGGPRQSGRTSFAGDAPESAKLTSAGRSAEVEYQRTVGALFAVFWLLRLDIEGKESFTYGVDDDWEPNVGAHVHQQPVEVVMPVDYHRETGASSVPDPTDVKPLKKLFSQMSPREKRNQFMKNMDWLQFHNLVVEAGCWENSPDYIECIMAMLCLTSFHDIMKVEELLPTVQAEHAPFMHYRAGDVIQDHDAALAYVLEHYPRVLPSFAGLPAAAQELVIFSQGKLHFNHGWFVQAEAPPGSMLSGFKAVLAGGGALPRHVGFYFLHWFTDLAGAEATPLGGAEKFVLKFPHDVLASFLWSMPFLGKLVDMTETAVVESYLKDRWTQLDPEAPLLSGSRSIACMRLAVMVQKVDLAVSSFGMLSYQEQAVLGEELARTGCEGQYYTDCSVQGGPAFLVYYGPALIQQNCGSVENLTIAMSVFAKVLTAARNIWPVKPELEARTVTIQVGELKARTITEITTSPEASVRKVWILIFQNESEGAVKLVPAADLNAVLAQGQAVHVLDFSKPPTSSAVAVRE